MMRVPALAARGAHTPGVLRVNECSQAFHFDVHRCVLIAIVRGSARLAGPADVVDREVRVQGCAHRAEPTRRKIRCDLDACAGLLRIRTGGSRASCPLRSRDGSNESSNGRSTPVLDRDMADREPYEKGGGGGRSRQRKGRALRKSRCVGSTKRREPWLEEGRSTRRERDWKPGTPEVRKLGDTPGHVFAV